MAVLVQAQSLCLSGRFADALALLAPLLASPDTAHAERVKSLDIAAVCSLGVGEMADAETYWRRAIEIEPDFIDSYNNLGIMLKGLGRFAEAEALFRQLLMQRPDIVEAHNNLGTVLYALKRVPEAERAYRHAILLRDGYADARYNLALLLFHADRLTEAEVEYRQVLRLRPDAAEAHNNLGNLRQVLNHLSDAEVHYRMAIGLQPGLAEAHYNLGSVTREGGRLDEAEAAYRQALALRPDYRDAQFGLATLLISTGRFDEGWQRYESRYDNPLFIHGQTRALLHCAQWRGESLAGKSVLVWQEDGLGDMIQFGRYLPLLKAAGARHITLACVPALHRLMANVEGVDAVLDHDTAQAQASGHDYWTSLLSAPLHLRTRFDAIPAPLHVPHDPALHAPWQASLDALPDGVRIGLVWKGNPKHHNDANRSLPSLSTLAPLWELPDAQFVSLQKGQGEDEALAAPGGMPLLHLGSTVTDFADSAAVIAQLDLLICVDTSMAHLAASLGKPCWLLLPARDIDWRWMHDRDDSPWYPETMRLFRQARGETWADVVIRMKAACATWLGETVTA
ncbi:tetratricopeptide repeat-containing glycosyltransferase family protein [Paraburkholderia sp.]|uniref:tetratricopeptide repeat-containing glycosyltransferase family protein n=1 Tax=Paraburkholderia sp. TaxID=1926495 RepID=UPI00239B79EB|nr:tetratricopeptide repeat-containing glycosyltransferase family protein [Paraburkholderia sp.]MDE1179070.1 tetratricopeptide repeat-containing glycosyltransferase family protein [Paraburkholderia sp.]